MGTRLEEFRWTYRFLLLDVLLAVAAKVGVNADRLAKFVDRADELRQAVGKSV